MRLGRRVHQGWVLAEEELYAIAVELESEGLEGEDERVLGVADLLPVLESLQEKGVDFRALASVSGSVPLAEDLDGEVDEA
jgi:hypothetical protein